MCDVLFLWSQALFKAGEEKFGTDEQSFVTILGNRSAEHLRKGLSVIAVSASVIVLEFHITAILTLICVLQYLTLT